MCYLKLGNYIQHATYNRTTKLLHIRKVSLKPVKVHRRIFHLFPPKYWSYFRTQFSQIESKQNLGRQEVLCLLLKLTTYSKVSFMNTKKRGFFLLLFNLTLFRSRISSTQLHHRYNVLICSHGGLRLQAGVHLDYLQSTPTSHLPGFQERLIELLF